MDIIVKLTSSFNCSPVQNFKYTVCFPLNSLESEVPKRILRISFWLTSIFCNLMEKNCNCCATYEHNCPCLLYISVWIIFFFVYVSGWLNNCYYYCFHNLNICQQYIRKGICNLKHSRPFSTYVYIQRLIERIYILYSVLAGQYSITDNVE